MHAYQSGLLPNVSAVVISPLDNPEKARLDILNDRMHHSLRSSGKKDFPKCTFKRGITNLTLLTSDEWPGIIFSLCLILVSRQGQHLFWSVVDRIDSTYKTDECAFEVDMTMFEDDPDALDIHVPTHVNGEDDSDDDYDTDDDNEHCEITNRGNAGEDKYGPDEAFCRAYEGKKGREVASVCDPLLLLNLLEMLLCFHAWYKLSDTFPVDKDNLPKLQDSIRVMLESIKKRTPRDIKTTNWRLQKFHDLLHLVPNIKKYGAPFNFDAGPGERLLKDFAKKSSQNTQKRDKTTFLRQTNDRLIERQVIAKAMEDMPVEKTKSIRFRNMKQRQNNDVPNDHIDCKGPMQSTFVGNANFAITLTKKVRSEGNDRHRPYKTKWIASTKWLTRKQAWKMNSSPPIHPSVLHWFESNCSTLPGWPSETDSVVIYCWTHYKRNAITDPIPTSRVRDLGWTGRW
jgi:hypothetical protein